MTRDSDTSTETAGPPWLALFALALLASVVFALFGAGLERPSGDGVPGPAEWARERSQSGP